jgi:hypothetical protein
MRASFFAMYVGVVALAAGLAGCGGTKILGKSLPDETQVVDGPNLVLPPQFDLRPPREGDADAPSYEERLNSQKTQEAQALIAGAPVAAAAKTESATVPEADAWLVQKATQNGRVEVDPNVREELDATAKTDKVEEKKSSGWRGWFGKKGE